ncbi:MAG: hypothetical protein AAGC55_20530, partial [Myxococcota bacterium]
MHSVAPSLADHPEADRSDGSRDRRSPVGRSVPRVDGIAKVTGTAEYVDDLTMPGMLHGATVRSQVAHGVLEAITLDPDYDWTDITVATAEDIPGDNVVTLIELDQPALVPIGGRIRHIDEAVAVVAAPDRRRAFEAARHVQLTIRPLPSIHTIEDALTGDVVLHGEDNVFKSFLIRKGEGDIDRIMAGAEVI